MWLVAYLVLVVGVAQGVLGIGQAWLAPMPPSTLLLTGQWCLFNAGNAWVMAGTLQTQSAWVSGGALLLVISLGLFMIGVRHARRSPGLFVYRGLLVLVSCSALLGVMLAIFRPHA